MLPRGAKEPREVGLAESQINFLVTMDYLSHGILVHHFALALG